MMSGVSVSWKELSRGPVYYEENIYGVFIGNCFNSSNYICDKLRDLNIDINN